MNEKQFNEIHKKLAGPTAAPDGAFTFRQLLARSGLGRQAARDLLDRALEMKMAKFIGRLPVKNNLGETSQVPHYKFLQPKPPPKPKARRPRKK